MQDVYSKKIPSGCCGNLQEREEILLCKQSNIKAKALNESLVLCVACQLL